MIKFGSVCSGIEAASVAWAPLGWHASWLAEIEPFPSAVLSHHYPETKNLGDMTKIADMVANKVVSAPDVLIGGTPCQSFSVAGMRKGLSDERGALTIKFVELANAIDDIRCGAGLGESIIVWENVPGVLSSKDNAFGCFLAALAGENEELRAPRGKWSNSGCVFGPQRAIAWRVLDAQYFGVAQRRKRVFVIASARDRFNPAEVLFEFDGLRRDLAPRENDKIKDGQIAGTLTTRTGVANDNYSCEVGHCIVDEHGARWLTPLECERLQGFPDNYTRIPYRGKLADICPDSPRYKAIGNSMAVPVIKWIGERIDGHLRKLSATENT